MLREIVLAASLWIRVYNNEYLIISVFLHDFLDNRISKNDIVWNSTSSSLLSRK